MVQIDIKLVEYVDKEVLRNLMEYYLYDFSEMEHLDVDPHGRFEYKYLDHYWTENGRYPYFIIVNGFYAGFVLVRTHEIDRFSISEFFVMRKYRRQSVGEKAAQQVFDQHPGNWEVRELARNVVAQAFWRKVINKYTNGHYQEVKIDDEEWHGPVQTFSNQKEAE